MPHALTPRAKARRRTGEIRRCPNPAHLHYSALLALLLSAWARAGTQAERGRGLPFVGRRAQGGKQALIFGSHRSAGLRASYRWPAANENLECAHRGQPIPVKDALTWRV